MRVAVILWWDLGSGSSSRAPQDGNCLGESRCGLRLVKVVAEFPEELVIAFGYIGVADLIGAIECELFGELVVEAGVDVAVSLVAAVPLGG